MAVGIILPAKLERITDLWSEVAGEPVTVERLDGKTVGFGSELACLRLYRSAGGVGRVGVAEPEHDIWYYASARLVSI